MPSTIEIPYFDQGHFLSTFVTPLLCAIQLFPPLLRLEDCSVMNYLQIFVVPFGYHSVHQRV